MLPKANAIFARLIVIIVKNSVLKDLIYLFVSKRIVKLIIARHNNRIDPLVVNAILEIKTINKDKNIEIGKIG